MCVIIDRPPGRTIPKRYLVTAMEDNPDGWGMMKATSHGIFSLHGMDEKGFWDAYEFMGDGDLTIHFRWATHGLKDVINCHPFEILNGEYAVVHNGIIHVDCEVPDMSDTWHFANGMLAEALRLHPEWWGGRRFRKYLEHKLGSNNKLVILRSDGEKMFINRKEGVQDSGLWLSNAGPLTENSYNRYHNYYSGRDVKWWRDRHISGSNTLMGQAKNENTVDWTPKWNTGWCEMEEDQEYWERKASEKARSAREAADKEAEWMEYYMAENDKKDYASGGK